MFARLTGRVDQVGEQNVIVDVNGVGYLVFCSRRTMANLNTGEISQLLIETHVREDAINLYGFFAADEQAWFKLLITVQGVGARVAMAILSTLDPMDISTAIAVQDKAMISRADGVGPKLATRIVTELKDKIPESLLNVSLNSKQMKNTTGRHLSSVPPISPIDQGSQLDSQVISALSHLGYSRSEAFSALIKVKENQNIAGQGHIPNLSEMIRLSLSELSKNVA